MTWKKVILANTWSLEKETFNAEMENDVDFYRFRRVHPNIQKPSPIWYVAKYMLLKYYNMAKVIAYSTRSTEQLLCEHYGHMYSDSLVHFTTSCPYTLDERNYFWDTVVNVSGVEIAEYPYMYNADKTVAFLRISVNYIA